MTADESHDAWLSVFAAVTGPPPDARRAPCPNCGHFAVRFQYVADAATRVGFCALWCDNCGHGHVLARTRVPDGVEFVSLDASEEEVRAAIPEFWDAAAADAVPPVAHDDSAIASRLAELRPRVAEYELLKALGGQQEFESRLLSPREREVATLLRQGFANREIAQQLMVSSATVRTAIQRIYWKLGHDMRHKLHR